MGKAWRHGGYPIAAAEVYVTQLANETRPSVVEENTRAVLRLVLSSEVADIVPLPSERLARDYRQMLYRMLLKRGRGYQKRRAPSEASTRNPQSRSFLLGRGSRSRSRSGHTL